MIKRAIVEIDDLRLDVSYVIDDGYGYMMGDSPAQFELIDHGGQEAKLRPMNGEPFIITIRGGAEGLIGPDRERPVRFVVKS